MSSLSRVMSVLLFIRVMLGFISCDIKHLPFHVALSDFHIKKDKKKKKPS